MRALAPPAASQSRHPGTLTLALLNPPEPSLTPHPQRRGASRARGRRARPRRRADAPPQRVHPALHLAVRQRLDLLQRCTAGRMCQQQRIRQSSSSAARGRERARGKECAAQPWAARTRPAQSLEPLHRALLLPHPSVPCPPAPSPRPRALTLVEGSGGQVERHLHPLGALGAAAAVARREAKVLDGLAIEPQRLLAAGDEVGAEGEGLAEALVRRGALRLCGRG